MSGLRPPRHAHGLDGFMDCAMNLPSFHRTSALLWDKCRLNPHVGSRLDGIKSYRDWDAPSHPRLCDEVGPRTSKTIQDGPRAVDSMAVGRKCGRTAIRRVERWRSTNLVCASAKTRVRCQQPISALFWPPFHQRHLHIRHGKRTHI